MGLKKTGSSALQSFFEKNSVELQKQGIFIPKLKLTFRKETFNNNNAALMFGGEFNPKIDYNEESYYLHTGNGSQILEQQKLNPNLFDDMYKDAIQNKCHTVILSSETMVYEEQKELYKTLEKLKQFDINIFMYVRELYSYQWSFYQQALKAGFTYINYDEMRFPSELQKWLELPINQKKLFVFNFDNHKKDLIQHFFKALAIPIDMNPLKSDEYTNRSPTESEHNILVALQKNKRSDLAMYISYVLLNQNSTKETFRFYDPIFAKKIYEANKTTIEKVNTLLPENEKLPTEPHQPTGYTMKWNKSNINPKDIKLILSSFHKNEKIEKSTYKDKCPKDFDISAYYAKHFDIFIKNIDPYEHYAKTTKNPRPNK